ncbi:uncharacterized protein PFL1_01297 [Pseudozyma flocculosa PF-1]|uniref:Related to TAF7 - TFIID subunit (TBP-associated factor), 67 kD n=1 Tax=Pseudozyma flocculosa TaxID=84751 RepID=A0A5C3EWJ6_9BASI|nr:uncharacterized protein PFL1_01297 [Pseudozyma flocculosa PF-1]EPQ31108.1 hypothetical protein PFL1_01297 [Pseudozyma flocculosa PF-1]SPO35966.1 related to TAF7 - TFIID subunit (TBP-associated factor), 67 kD [Pseudozyma flocculosa]
MDDQQPAAQAMPPPSLPPRVPSGDSPVAGEASPSAGPSHSGPGRQVRPRRSVRPSAKSLQARENSPGAWEHGGRGQRSTRTPTGNRPQIKLKMRQAGGAAGGLGQGPKTKPYMQGFDRELDSEDDETGEGLAFEEQLILRMPEGPQCDKLREAVAKRQIGDDVWFKFKDSRRAVFHAGDALFSAKLVDLPSIVESHKTLDNRQFFKISDISQMLLIEDQIQDETQASGSSSGRGFDINDFIYPHGITPPMKWARKRRFRKRAPRRAIETVEKEVERLLKEDKKAEQVEYEIFDAANGLPPDLEDEEDADAAGEEDDDDGRSVSASVAGATSVADTPRPVGSDDEATQFGEGEEVDGSQMGDYDREARHGGDGYDDEDDVDEDLAAELDAALEEEDDAESARWAGSEAQSRASDQEDLWDDEDDDDGDDDDEEEGDEDENDDEKEARVREAQLEAECREIEALVRRKQADVDSTMNMIIKSRHQQALRRLTTERDIKRGQLADVKQARREKKEAKAAAAAAEEEAAAAEQQQQQQQHGSTPQDVPPGVPTVGVTSATPGAEDGGRAFASGSPERQQRAAPAARPSMPPPAFPASRSATASVAPVPMEVDTPGDADQDRSVGGAGADGDDDGDDDGDADDDDLWDDGDEA